MVAAQKYAVYSHSCIGASHIKQGKVCQDSSAGLTGKGFCLGTVCDGHGGADYFRSDIGSRIAAEAFVSGVKDSAFLKKISRADEDEAEALLQQFVKSLITRWNMAAEAHLAANPITEAELENVSKKAKAYYENGQRLASIYGTTFIGFAFVGDLCFGLQIGDGMCVAADKNGVLFNPIAEDGECFLNVTTSLSGEDAYEKFRTFIAKKGDTLFPSAVFLCTDGVSDSYIEENFYEFVSMALENFKSCDGAQNELFDYLPTLSEKGSGDDMSVCIIIDRGEAVG